MFCLLKIVSFSLIKLTKKLTHCNILVAIVCLYKKSICSTKTSLSSLIFDKTSHYVISIFILKNAIGLSSVMSQLELIPQESPILSSRFVSFIKTQSQYFHLNRSLLNDIFPSYVDLEIT